MTNQASFRRVRDQGVRSSAVVDLLAVALARREADVESTAELARKLLTSYGGLAGLHQLSVSQLMEIGGLEVHEALRFVSLMELGRRVETLQKNQPLSVDSPEHVANMLSDLRHEVQEHFVVLLLDAKNHLLRRVDVHKGTLNQSLVGTREVFRDAIREGASSIIVAHNHPSGDPTPSREDIEITKSLVAAGRLLDIPVDDHVIIGDRRHTSLRQRGLLGN
jgi:DNA repair protein RadC